MSRQTMFEVQENSIELVPNNLNGLQTIDEEEHRRELSAHEKKEFDRKKRFGKVGGVFFSNAEMSNDNDVIAAGSNFAVTQAEEEQTVKIGNLTEADIYKLKKDHLLSRFDKGTMLSPEIQEEAKLHFCGGPTVIQKYVVPLILYTNKDIIARAKTGSGKSAAFILPLIELIYQAKKKEPEEKRKQVNGSAPYAIIFEPTRELCIQLAKEVRRLAKGTSVKVAFTFGTIDMASSYRMARLGADILVGTPSRVNHMFFGIEGNKIHGACFDFSNLKYLVLDEADRLVDQAEFHTYSYPFKERLAENGVRVFMFSATDGNCESGKQMFTDDPIDVIVGGEEAPVRNIVQAFVEYDPTNTNIISYKRFEIDCPVTKMDYLVFLMDRYVTKIDESGYKRVPTTIVFVQNKRSSDSVAIWLLRRGFRATALNSDRETKTRIQAVRGIQTGHYDIVVATDVLARGINIPGVKTVINYELPVQSPLNYVHRIGRTARMGNIGRVVSFFDTSKNTSLAPYLDKWLNDCDQEVPSFLYKVSCAMTEKMEKRLMNTNPNLSINGIPQQRTVLEAGMTF